jgi:putative transposase
MANNAIKTLYIKPGAPWEQPFIESFHHKLRDECLNREIFGSLLEARIVIEAWRMEYNQRRPHSSLGYLTPAEFAAQQKFQSMQSRRHKDSRWALEPLGCN